MQQKKWVAANANSVIDYYLADPFFATVALLDVVAELHPALDPVVVGRTDVEKEEGGRGEQNA